MSDTVIKRTTLIVRDANRSIAFYRDVLGMKEYYNQSMTTSGRILPAGEAGATVHLGIMEGPHPDVGKIGLLQWTEPPLPDPGPLRERLGEGDLVFVAETDDMDALVNRIETSGLGRIHSPPEDWEVPLADGSGTKPISTMSFFDPDGFLFEVNHKPTDPQPESFVIRRTTLIVASVDQSLSLYRDALGLEVWYDQTMEVGGRVLPAGRAGDSVRVVILRCDAEDTGMLGLMEFVDSPVESFKSPSNTLGIGDPVFVAGANVGLQELHERLGRSPATIHAQPVPDRVTGADGATIELTTMSFFDPDGFFFELNERKAVS